VPYLSLSSGYCSLESYFQGRLADQNRSALFFSARNFSANVWRSFCTAGECQSTRPVAGPLLLVLLFFRHSTVMSRKAFFTVTGAALRPRSSLITSTEGILPSAIKGFLDDSVVISTKSMGIICVCRSIEEEGSKEGPPFFHREGRQSKQGRLR
jgi:hypothetical protein